MSDATAPTPAPSAPDDPLGHDGPTFVHNGIIRFPMGDKIVRVRRPFLGELKVVRLALQAAWDAIAEESNRVGEIGLAYQAEARAMQERMSKGEITPDEHRAAMAEASAKDRTTARAMDEFREQTMLGWWQVVFTGDGDRFAGLALDEVPDQLQWPTWMLDRALTSQVLTHWRTVPTGPG